MDYATLCANVQDTVENGFTDEMLALWAQQTEQKIYNLIQLPVMRKSAPVAAVSGVAQITLPTDCLFVYSLAVIDGSGAYHYLLNKDTNYVRQAYPQPTVQGRPRVYAIANDTTLLLGPTPDAAYAGEIEYSHYPESIVTAGETWLGDNYDSALFNGMLVEAARFLKSPKEVVDLYLKMFDEAVLGLKQLGAGKLRQDAYRSGQYREAVR